ncbi:YqiA/YcfP family alpha/beta fold hydrolase [Flavobacterium antarcticum]|uniref:YqiA/YcfP family alpha/beta fold hydrolase n=1 Tax=Flavobacterium antarcticum TaxID=271155 RepID=UPI0003B4EBDA|nr:YqiA/YcfP family alpha/beta fold hydrolase [Flavobacterium antarcticum]
MTILYLHGLESKLNPEKRAVLEEFGTVIAPDMDYHNNSKVYDDLLKTYRDQAIDCIIGSSMGGFMGYYVAMKWGCPVLLFNPALTKRSAHQEIPEIDTPKEKQRLSIVLGGKDEVVPAVSNLKFFSEHFRPTVQMNIKIRPELAHQITLEVFKEECSTFLKSL